MEKMILEKRVNYPIITKDTSMLLNAAKTFDVIGEMVSLVAACIFNTHKGAIADLIPCLACQSTGFL